MNKTFKLLSAILFFLCSYVAADYSFENKKIEDIQISIENLTKETWAVPGSIISFNVNVSPFFLIIGLVSDVLGVKYNLVERDACCLVSRDNLIVQTRINSVVTLMSKKRKRVILLRLNLFDIILKLLIKSMC